MSIKCCGNQRSNGIAPTWINFCVHIVLKRKKKSMNGCGVGHEVGHEVVPTVGVSEFARANSIIGTGNSYTTTSLEVVAECVRQNWDYRRPGAGETETTRKVLVPVFPGQFFCSPCAPLSVGMNIKSRVVQRQIGEDPYIETYLTVEDAEKMGIQPIPAKRCDIVCYSAEALMENNGHRSTDCDFEIVTILAYSTDVEEPMTPLTMARNFLQKPGGTFGVYSAQEFAESIYYHATKKMIKIIKE